MRRRTLLAVGLIAGWFLSAAVVRGQAVQLPRDPKTPIIILDFQSGPKRDDPEPVLVIHADGRVVVSTAYGRSKRVETTIPVAEVQALLRYIVQEQAFFDFDEATTAAVKEAMRAKALGIVHSATTVLRVKTATREHAVSFYALAASAKKYPDIKSLSRLAAVVRRLSRVRCESLAGGSDAVAKMLALVNEHLKQQYPDARPLTPADLHSTHWMGETMIVQFHRNGERPDLYVAGSVKQRPQGEAEVTVGAQLK